MIAPNDIRDVLQIPETDEQIQKVITRCENFLKTYCNNDTIDFSDGALDDIVLDLVVRKLDPLTKSQAGKTSINMGYSVSFSDDLSPMHKKALIKFKRVKFI